MYAPFLPYLADELTNARKISGLSYAHIAVHVVKANGRAGISESTLHRFEHARHWPENPDAIVAAYAKAVGIAPEELWRGALKRYDEREREQIAA